MVQVYCIETHNDHNWPVLYLISILYLSESIWLFNQVNMYFILDPGNSVIMQLLTFYLNQSLIIYKLVS